MGRGRALNTKIREAKGIAKAIGQGIQKADEGKPLEESLKEHLGRMIDRIDPLESLAVIGVTFLIKQGIEWTEELQYANLAAIHWFLDLLSWPSKFPWPNPTKEQFDSAVDSPNAEMIQWALSFAIAYVIVHNFDAVISLGKDVISIAKNLIGIGVVAT